MERFAKKTGRPLKGFTEEAMELLQNYNWPGNVRELQNGVERAVVLSTSDRITLADIRLSGLRTPVAVSTPPTMLQQSPDPHHPSLPIVAAALAETSKFEKSLESLEQEYILATLERSNWNKSQAATILGIERSTLDRKLKKYGVNRPTTE